MKTLCVVLLASISGCSWLPNEPWMAAYANRECDAMQQSIVRKMIKQCDPIYIGRYCEGVAVIEICRGGVHAISKE